MEPRDKQLRARCTAKEYERVEELVAEGGYDSVTELIRTLMLDSHLVLVGANGLFLAPARNSTDAATAEARHTLQALIAGAQHPSRAETSPPESAEPGEDPGEEPSAVAPSPPALPAVPAVEDDFAAMLAGQAPPLEEDSAARPPILDNPEAYVAERAAVLRLEGNSPLMATSIAEREVVAAAKAQTEAAVATATTLPGRPEGSRPRPDLEAAQAAHGACAACGTALAGTGFCSHCGMAEALSEPPNQNGDGA